MVRKRAFVKGFCHGDRKGADVESEMVKVVDVSFHVAENRMMYLAVCQAKCL